MSYLEKISHDPTIIKTLTISELKKVCNEIREFIIKIVSKNGGHLASNLGAVELTLALHYVFDLSRDKFIFDVGHQCYTHKILTKRLDKFETLRQFGGLSGFPKISESNYDAFGTGHASTSISAALGYAIGRDLNNENYYVGAIIGDASLASGMPFEALNHLGHLKKQMLIILNDNEMAISQNIGALSIYLEKIRVGKFYNKLKEEIETLLKLIPIFGSNIAKIAERLKSSIKYLLVPGVIFEELGIKYVGPIDGHDIEQLINTFENAKDYNGPLLIHTVTKKGKGYQPAEEAPEKYHSGNVIDLNKSYNTPQVETFTDVFGKTIVELGEQNPKIVAITAAMTDGTGLREFSEKFKDRFFDVGICEQHAVTLACGMALTGLIPILAIYSTFIQRAFDQFIHDVALQNLHVILCLDRAGLVGEDGPTHHGAFDISMFKMVPNTIIIAPSTFHELKNAMYNAVYNYNQPVVIRYPKGTSTISLQSNSEFQYTNISIGEYNILKEGKDIAILSCGSILDECIKAHQELVNKYSLNCELIDLRFVKPISNKLIDYVGNKFNKIIIVEENVILGGIGESIISNLYQKGFNNKKVKLLGLPDKFVEHGNTSKLKNVVQIDSEAIIKTVLEI